MPTPFVYAIATMDTKEDEIRFVAKALSDRGVNVRLVDVGTNCDAVGPVDLRISVEHSATLDRGEAIKRMGFALEERFRDPELLNNLGGVIGIGGSGGTAIVSRLLRSLPIGLPKVMVSTMASGNTIPYVDCSDIFMLYSVVDVAGLNQVLKQILTNAAAAMAGMIESNRPPEPSRSKRPTVAMTMFGVTTACVTAVRERLEYKGYNCLVFHATGTGGRAMEKLVESGYIDGVLDITTTEVADEIVGGIMPAGSQRIRTIVAKQIPYVVSVGAVDMVNFGALKTVPPQFANRQLHGHNEHVTLMRTTTDENSRIGAWIVERLNESKSPITVVLPVGGVSALDADDEIFRNPSANAALFKQFENHLNTTEQRQLVESAYHVNDPEFADLLVAEFCGLLPVQI